MAASADECLNDHWFSTLHEARVLKDYNSTQPHSSLGNNTPVEFAAQHQFAN
jgi:putative transposase